MPAKPTLVPAEGIDAGALAGDFQREVATRVAEMIAYVIDGLESNDRPLSELQKTKLIEAAIRHFDGMELWFAKELVREFDQAGLPVWGLPSEIEKLLDPRP